MPPPFLPMLASLLDAPLDSATLAYEPKYDGIRALVEVSPRDVRLWSRLGNDKTAQFPEIASALRRWAARLKAPVILDGEIVALDAHGDPTGFQQLQGRIHLSEADEATAGARVAFVAFDLLRDGRQDLRERPLLDRRAALETLFRLTGSPLLRISEFVRGDGHAMYDRALASGWEGLIAKEIASRYKAGKRSPEWRKLKIVYEQEFVIGGWTDPRHSREYFGALLLGVYDAAGQRRGRRTSAPVPAAASLVYVGHTGTGFNERELARVMKLLAPLETTTCPFAVRPKTNERPHWVRPELVAQIKFTEWTTDGKLRHPVYLGLRDDKKPADVVREQVSRMTKQTTARGKAVTAESAGVKAPRPVAPPGRRAGARANRATASRAGAVTGDFDPVALVDELRSIENSRQDGVLQLPDGGRVAVSNLHKVFWPGQPLTKGDLLRYYVRAAPFILPVVADRPLVMKRYPNGVRGKAFYQQRAPDEVPPGVRVMKVRGDGEVPSRVVGGSLETLLYLTQLAAISQDPWFSRVDSPEQADFAALDLDPADGMPFSAVLDVARWLRDELATLGITGFPKTSGADGLHIYLPLPAGTPYDAGLLFCQIVATVVAQRHSRVATVERSVSARGKRVYIDYLQNIRGKTLACAYSARASAYAGVSTPLTWKEVDAGVRREDFTIESVPGRLAVAGDLWKPLRDSTGIDLATITRYAEAGNRPRPRRAPSRRG